MIKEHPHFRQKKSGECRGYARERIQGLSTLDLFNVYLIHKSVVAAESLSIDFKIFT